MPHHCPRRHQGAALDADLLDQARPADPLGKRPTVVAAVKVADPNEADALRVRQRAALVRLLRQAVELRRVV